ncbi:MAG TPA: hypothetical protein VN328_00300 [Thermodesulfovibrionales bacterium]|nr:hypothetical protein [Thermodesulfovibrionales bacterium]
MTTVDGMVNETAEGTTTGTVEAMAGIDMTTEETLTIVVKKMSNSAARSNSR